VRAIGFLPCAHPHARGEFAKPCALPARYLAILASALPAISARVVAQVSVCRESHWEAGETERREILQRVGSVFQKIRTVMLRLRTYGVPARVHARDVHPASTAHPLVNRPTWTRCGGVRGILPTQLLRTTPPLKSLRMRHVIETGDLTGGVGALR